MRVLVTGGTGFIGGAVHRHLQEAGHESKTFDLSQGLDVRSFNDLRIESEDCDAIIHMAGKLGTHELFDEIDAAIDVNIKGTVNVLEACRANGLSYVGISMPQVFKSIYTATKVCTGWIASAFHETYGVPVSHVRAYNAFGPGQAHGAGHPQKIIPTFAYNITHGLPVPVWGDGEQTVDLIHTSDLARMLVDAVNFGDDDHFDGGTGVAFTVNETIKMVADMAGVEAEVEYLPMRRGERPTQIVATGEGWEKLDWQPYFRPDDLQVTVDYYRDYVIH